MNPRNSTLKDPPAHTPLYMDFNFSTTDRAPTNSLFSPVGLGEALVEEPLGYEKLQKAFSVVNTQTFLDLMSENCRVAAAALEIKVKVAKVAQS